MLVLGGTYVFQYRYDGRSLALTQYDLPHHRVRKLLLSKLVEKPAARPR